MPKILGQFHVNFPIKSKIRFAEILENRVSPIFVEALSDRYVQFYSFLDFPRELKGNPVKYVFEISFLSEQFVLEGQLEELLEDGFVKKYEAKFNIDDYERGQLFQLLNQYNLFLRGVANKKREKEKKLEKEKSGKQVFFSRKV